MVDDKRFDVFTELLHTGIGITDYGKELTGQDVVDLMNEQIDDKAKLECQLRKRTRQRNQLADLNVKLMEENKLLARDNEKLKKEKEFWKSDACSLSSLNSILSNELSIAQEQGYEPSKPYKEYIASIKTEYDKFWENKIKTHNNRLKELEND